MDRRHFLQTSGVLALQPFSPGWASLEAGAAESETWPPMPQPLAGDSPLAPIDLSPGRWIWYPMGRCLPSTVVLLRRELTLFVPAEIEAELILDAREKVALAAGREPAPRGCRSYALPRGETVKLRVAG
jgi:hypothetical protein